MCQIVYDSINTITTTNTLSPNMRLARSNNHNKPLIVAINFSMGVKLEAS